jgi:hypothetical protein
VRTIAHALALLAVAVCAASASAATTLVFRRADGSAITFPKTVRTWCDTGGLHAVGFGTIGQSHWQLGIARMNVRSGRVLPYSWQRPNGVELFVFDAKTRNEASEGAEGSHGRVEPRRASCARGARVEIAVSGVIASEFSDGKPVRVSGTFVGRVGARPR